MVLATAYTLDSKSQQLLFFCVVSTFQAIEPMPKGRLTDTVSKETRCLWRATPTRIFIVANLTNLFVYCIVNNVTHL
jgi:hypothetical protein